MNRLDYISEVDALRAPDALRNKIGSLSADRGARRPRRAVPSRWCLAAASLVLVAGLSAAAPAVFRAFFTGGDIITPPPAVTETYAISDEELTELLAAEFPDPDERDQHTLLFSASQNGRTLGVLRTVTSFHSGGFANLLFGVFDNASKALVGEARIHRGDFGELYTWTDREMRVQLLWTNYSSVMAWASGSGAGLYTFSQGELTAAAQLPQSALDAGLSGDVLTMFDPAVSADFWEDHNAVINGTGLDLYRRNPDYNTITNSEVDQWLFDCHVPLDASTGPDAPKAPPELRANGDELLIRYPGGAHWTDVLSMLPLPAEWSTDSHAPAVDGVTSMTGLYSGLYFGFTSPTEGWLVLGGDAAMGTAYNYVYLTHDGGHTWVERTGKLNADCPRVLNCAVFSDEKHGFLGFRYQWDDSAPFYWTENGGETWEPYDQDFLPLPRDGDTVYELKNITFTGSEGTLAFTRYTHDDQGQRVDTALTIKLSDYGTARQMDDKPVFEEPLNPYSVQSNQLPYGDPSNAWMAEYATLPLRPLARLPEEGIDLYGFNEYWCGTSGVLLVRDRDMSTAVWYILPCSRSSGSCSLVLADYDGDGQDELAFTLTQGSGTGIAKYGLYMVELEGRGFLSCTVFDEVCRPLVLEALRTLGAEQYDQFGQWQIYSFEDGVIRMELGVQAEDNPSPFLWQGFLSADIRWDGEAFSLENCAFSKSEQE